jgi:hypothetical protein
MQPSLLGGFLNCARCFSPKSLALVLHRSGKDFVKAVSKIIFCFFSIARFMNSWAAHKDQLLAHKVHSPTLKSSVLNKQQLWRVCCTDNNQLKVAAEETAMGATAMAAAMVTARTIK